MRVIRFFSPFDSQSSTIIGKILPLPDTPSFWSSNNLEKSYLIKPNPVLQNLEKEALVVKNGSDQNPYKIYTDTKNCNVFMNLWYISLLSLATAAE